MPDIPISFDQVHAEYRGRVQAYLRRFVEPAEAEDLVQEVFLKVHQNLDTFRHESRLATWIFQIATHAALDRLKSVSHRMRHQTSEHFEAHADSPGHMIPDHGGVPLKDEMCACIHRFIDELSVNHRVILSLSDVKELSLGEISRILDISPGAAKIRLHRARQALRARLEQDCRILLDERGEVNCDRKVLGSSGAR